MNTLVFHVAVVDYTLTTRAASIINESTVTSIREGYLNYSSHDVTVFDLFLSTRSKINAIL